MSADLHNQIYQNMNLKETGELLDIWQTNNREEWSDEAMEIVREILLERGVEIPEQVVILDASEEEQDAGDDGLEEWEARILDDENQPDFYDPLEVMDLKDNINKTAKAVIIVYILEGIVYFSSYLPIVRSYFSNFQADALLIYFISFLVAALSTAVSIAIIYFPLKALTYILRILMEMEFRSRKAL
jgi:hypothetical protein